MKDKIEKIYKSYSRKLDKLGFINLNHLYIDSKDRIIAFSEILRSYLYETFRIIYMNDNNIVGEEIISVKRPITEVKLNTEIFGRIKSQINIEKIEERMKSLNSNSYYLVHNHKSDKLSVSKEEIILTKYYFKKVNGYKGHLIINSNSYLWIDYIKNEIIVSKEVKFNSKKSYIKLNSNRKNNIKICNRDDIVSLIRKYINSRDYSICIASNLEDTPRMTFEITNDLIKNEKNELNKYLEKIRKINKGSKIFFITKDKNTFDISRKLVNEKIIDYSGLM